MPPLQCPDCARFLANELVEALSTTPQPCPGCGLELTSRVVADNGTDSATPQRDVLEGWDAQGDQSAWRDDAPPVPLDALVVGGAAVIGGLIGALTNSSRARGFAGGAAAGAAAAAIVRKIWRLEG